MTTPTRPPLRYHGGKWKLGPWIASFFPAHDTYVEPFGGAAGVLLQKQPAPNEIYNDLDGNVVNLFRVLRSPVMSEELIRLLRLTPYASEEYDKAQAVHIGGAVPECPVERARLTIVYAAMSYGGYMPRRSTQFRRILQPKRSAASLPARFQSLVEQLEPIVERLTEVVIEQMSALEVMRIYDSPATLHYVDPPYVPETRTTGSGYAHEMTYADHEALLQCLRDLQGFVVVSGYSSDLYEQALADWRREDQLCGTIGARHGEKSKKLEVLWLSPNIPEHQLLLWGSWDHETEWKQFRDWRERQEA